MSSLRQNLDSLANRRRPFFARCRVNCLTFVCEKEECPLIAEYQDVHSPTVGLNKECYRRFVTIQNKLLPLFSTGFAKILTVCGKSISEEQSRNPANRVSRDLNTRNTPLGYLHRLSIQPQLLRKLDGHFDGVLD